jgi:hypothetical protein
VVKNFAPALPLKDASSYSRSVKLCAPATLALQLVIFDERGSFGGWKPLRRSLLRLWPILRRSFDQQGEHFNLTWNGSDTVLQPFLVDVVAKREVSDATTNTSLLASLPRSRLRRLQTLYGPAFRDDPSFRFARGNERHLDRNAIMKAVGERPVLNTNWRFRL